MSRSSDAGGVRVNVAGIVQGVGFRPFVHRLAARHQLNGWVRNTSADVEIALEGDSSAVDAFVTSLTRDAPPLARIDSIAVATAPLEGFSQFVIGESDAAEGRGQLVAPDVAMCAACERELADPANRRYRYPFITCTDCGPRYSVIEAMPYDRARTSMRAFAQCPECRREYDDPADRRYHSETNSCPACGPRLRLLERNGGDTGEDDPVASAARAIVNGAIVAVRGVGGFHLAVDATNEAAVRRLRQRKHRDGKPLAVMARSLDAARALAWVGDEEAAALTGSARPIVILRVDERVATPIAPSVSCGLPTLGVMLAYSPLHVLLLEAVGRPLVMTSGNPSGEPLAASLADARRTLGDIADAYLTHDREIVAPIDDSVVRFASRSRVMMRRARGFAPLPATLPIEAPVPLVAVGPHLKNTLTLAIGRDAFVSPHLGDLETLATEEHWLQAFASMQRLFDVQPSVAVRDQHPGYLTTRIAERLPVARVMVVQHHHAHVAAILAEHGVTRRVLGVSFDGTGYGDDGLTWGAEILVADLLDYRRAAHLRYVPLPGGDRAARSPWRSALAYESLIGNGELACACEGVPAHEVAAIRRQIAARFNAPLASSMGRLFDAAAAILGICHESLFEGDAAMRLEAAAYGEIGHVVPFEAVVRDENGALLIDPVPLLRALRDGRRRGVSVAQLAADFHASIAAGTASIVARLASEESLDEVVLSGGVYQNALLLESTRRELERRRLTVLVARELPPNDGAVSYGQAAIAAARLARQA